MSEGGVLQHLLAEQAYRVHGIPVPEQTVEESIDGQGNRGCGQRGNSPYTKPKQNDTERNQMHPFETTVNDIGYKQRSKNPPRRALSDDSPVSQAHPFLKNSSRSAEAASPHFTQYIAKHSDSDGSKQSRPVLSQASGLISRLRQEFLSKPSPHGMQDSNAGPEPTQDGFGGPRLATPTPLTGTDFGRTSFPSPSTSKQQLHGHPKSNSGGEEFLYTDRKSKLPNGRSNRRHPRGKSGASVARSRSLHFKDEPGSQHFVQKRPATDLGLGNEPFLGTPPGMCSTPRKKSDTSTLSSGSFASDLKSSSVSQTSLNADNYYQIATSEEGNTSVVKTARNTSDVNATQYQHPLTNNPRLSGMVLTPSGVGGLPQQSMTPPGPHGPFYATVPTNPIGHHQMTQGQLQANITTPLRGPPPPYPQGAANMEDIHQPQRPNSLPLGGRVSRKKMEYSNGGHVSPAGLTSPAMSTSAHTTNFPNYAMSAGTPVHGASFFSMAPEVATTTTTNGSNNTVLQSYQPMPLQQLPTQQPQFTRSGSGGVNGVGFHPMPQAQRQSDMQSYGSVNNSSNNTSSSSSSTVVGTPVSYQQQRYDAVPPLRAQTQQTTQHSQPSTSPSYGQQFVQQQAEYPTQPGNTYSGAGPASGYSLGKSDSVNSNASTSSSGSRIARRAKRNSKNFSNTSGSSSSTGNSRPNSSADFLERIMSENDMLKTQLQTANQKLKKYQNVEKDLLRVSEEYKALHSSAAKSEEMERHLRTQLEATNRRTQQENEILRERIKTLAELVETLQSSNKDAQTTSTSDIMMYKVKVQELQTQVRMLQEQLDESNEKISEQQADHSLLSSSLGKTQATIASLKEKLLEKQKSEKYVDDLSPVLDMLSATVRSRLRVENDLEELVKLNQRRSTSSNDEGISEMDSGDAAQATSQSSDVTQQTTSRSRDEQLIRTHAQMLKWQHMYLEATLFRELSTAAGEATSDGTQTANGPLYNMLYRHRHAASDPSFNKNTSFWFPSWDSSPLNSLLKRDDVDLPRHHKHDSDVKRRPPTQRRDNVCEQSRSSPRRRRRETAPTLNDKKEAQSPSTSHTRPRTKSHQKGEEKATTDKTTEGQTNNVVEFEENMKTAAQEKTEDCEASTSQNEAPATESNEFDSPSEGYHSQQSSGSPTPSSERSSLHFPEGDSRVTAALASVQDSASCTTSVQANSATVRQPTTPTTNTGLYLLGSASGNGKTVLTKVADV